MKSPVFPFLALIAASTVVAQSSTCPFNYPVNLNVTESSNGLVFTVASTNAVTNNRAIQLRTNPNLAGGSLRGSTPHPHLYNQLYDLGPTAYLNLRDEINGTDRYTVGFANASTWPGQVDREWYLSGGAPDGTYDLFHDEPLGIVNGFVLCVADHDLEPGPWYQLFYYTYADIPADYPECEYVGIRTTVAATIYNGECDIGGFVA
ncbi:hypothetical protein ONZ43_g7248 [Nemania bipapillata]|uniref:Uncharacterized protein n=1 Tax=Nemania bipapillata TaxID=110536 RepID=A0ACC2HSP5_9PEZI|nr:hypothetical protein ONZ43_g7248 [Nemania bipapillata]